MLLFPIHKLYSTRQARVILRMIPCSLSNWNHNRLAHLLSQPLIRHTIDVLRLQQPSIIAGLHTLLYFHQRFYLILIERYHLLYFFLSFLFLLLLAITLLSQINRSSFILDCFWRIEFNWTNETQIEIFLILFRWLLHTLFSWINILISEVIYGLLLGRLAWLFGGAVVEAFALFELICVVPGTSVIDVLLSYYSLMHVGDVAVSIAFCDFYLLGELFWLLVISRGLEMWFIDTRRMIIRTCILAWGIVSNWLVLHEIISVVKLMIASQSQMWLLMLPVCHCQFFCAHVCFWYFYFDCFDILIINFIKLNAGALAFTLEILSD